MTLPKCNHVAEKFKRDPDFVVLGEEVIDQVSEFVTTGASIQTVLLYNFFNCKLLLLFCFLTHMFHTPTVASVYHDNPFHNFQHALHLTLLTVKLMAQTVSPDHAAAAASLPEESEDDKGEGKLEVKKDLHNHAPYGITSDALTRFACIFFALIHNVDHVGVPNSMLFKENPRLAKVYQNCSISEQNSVDLAWDLLCKDEFKAFCRAIYSNIPEFKCFLQLFVNGVMATNIMNKGLKAIRSGKWDKTFNEEMDVEELHEDKINCKATIVIEHLIQASDVCHTMQHWHIYVRWNKRCFMEIYKAYKEGRAETDPTDNWYMG